MTPRTLGAAFLALAVAANAAAQTAGPADPVAGATPAASGPVDTRLPGRFLVGANVTQGLTPESGLGDTLRFGVVFSLRPKPGWGPAFGLGWYRSELTVPADGVGRSIGTVRVRPIMGGIGYTWVKGHASLRARALAGWAFTSAELDEIAPGVDVTLDVEQTWAVQPGVDIMLAVARRLALVGSAKYTIARPVLRVTATDGSVTESAAERLRSDYFALSAGLAVSIF